MFIPGFALKVGKKCLYKGKEWFIISNIKVNFVSWVVLSARKEWKNIFTERRLHE